MWSKDIVVLLIERYREHENLYNVSHPQYLDRVKRSNTLFKICNELKEQNKKITLDELKKKIHTLRSQFVRELRVVKEQQEQGVAEIVVKLWCFDKLEFLKPYVNTTVKRPPPDSSPTDSFSNNSSIKVQTKRRKTEEQEDLNNVVVDAFEESGNDLSVLAHGWSSQYAELSRRQKVLARKIISDVLFHGCLDNLTEDIVQEIQNIFENNTHKTYDPLNNDE